MTHRIDRRDFLRLTGAGVMGSALHPFDGFLQQVTTRPSWTRSAQPTPRTKLRDVNSTDLRSAIALGQNPMNNVFNADDQDIPYFLVLARPVALMAFVPNLSEAFIPGHMLGAILRSEGAAGVSVDENAVLKHTRGLFFAFSGGSPLPLNRQEIGSKPTHFVAGNLRPCFNGLTALIERRRSARARDVAEACLGAVLDLWSPSGGWDARRMKQQWGVTYVDPFEQLPAEQRPRFPEFAGAFGSIADYYRVTGSARALALITMVRDHAMADYLTPGGNFAASRLGSTAGNTGGRLTTMLRGMMQIAAVTRDGALMVRTKEYFDHTVPLVFNDLGWSLDLPETADDDSDCACRLAKAMDLALLVGEAGFPEGYDFAERVIRGYLLPSQLRDASFFSQPPARATGDGVRDVSKRTKGSWGSPAPYGHQPEGAKRVMFNTDIVGDVLLALCRAFEDVARFDHQGHQVNLLFDRSTPDIDVHSPYTHDSLMLILKRRAPVRVRVPLWLARADIEVVGARALPQLVNGYLYIEETPARTITVRFPLTPRSIERRYRGKPIRVRLAGDEVRQMDSFAGADATFFDPIA